MWKKLVYGALAAVTVLFLTLPAPALADSWKHGRHHRGNHGRGHHHGSYHHRPPVHYHHRPPVHYHYRPPVHYHVPPVRYYAPPPRYYYHSYRPGVNVDIVLPFPFFSFHLR
jgi:hypothetical protein